MNEVGFIAKYTPALLYFLGTLMLIVFTKNYLFKGMIPDSQYKDMLDREKSLVKAQEDVSNSLKDIVGRLEALTKKVSEEIGANTDRIRTLEAVMSDFLDEFRKLTYNFELHRKGVPSTEVFLAERKKRNEP